MATWQRIITTADNASYSNASIDSSDLPNPATFAGEIKLSGDIGTTRATGLTLYNSNSGGYGPAINLNSIVSSSETISAQLYSEPNSATKSDFAIKTRSGGTLANTMYITGRDTTFAGEVLVNNARTNLNLASTQTAPNKLATVLMIKGYDGSSGDKYSGIGFNYGSSGDVQPPAWIGIQGMSGAGHSKADIVFATRSVTTDTAPTERMRISTDGSATFAGDIHMNGAYLGLANDTHISCGDSGSGSIHIRPGGTNYGGYINLRAGGNGGDFRVNTGTSGSGTLALTIDSSQVATFSSDVKVSRLKVNDKFALEDQSSALWFGEGFNSILMKKDTTFSGDIILGTNDLYIGTAQGDNIIHDGSGQEIVFATDGSTALTLDNSQDTIFSGDALPTADKTKDLGSSTKRWANLYVADMHLKNDRGDWTVIEEEDYLSLKNNKNGKTYKLVMEEI